MSAPTRLRLVVLGPDPRVLAWIGTLAGALSRLAELPQGALEVIQRANGGIAALGLHLDLAPAGRAGELRTVVKVSQALRDLGLAVGAGDLDAEFVCNAHEFVSIGGVATSDVAHPAGQSPMPAPRVALSSGGGA